MQLAITYGVSSTGVPVTGCSAMLYPSRLPPLGELPRTIGQVLTGPHGEALRGRSNRPTQVAQDGQRFPETCRTEIPARIEADPPCLGLAKEMHGQVHVGEKDVAGLLANHQPIRGVHHL